METACHHPYLSFSEMGLESLTDLLNGLNCDKTMILRILNVKQNILMERTWLPRARKWLAHAPIAL